MKVYKLSLFIIVLTFVLSCKKKSVEHVTLISDIGIECEEVVLEDVSSPTTIIGDGTPGSITVAAIREALLTGGTIVVNCGSNPPTLAVSEPLIFTETTIFDGGGIILDGQNSSRIIEKYKAANQSVGLTLTIQNLTLQNGSHPEKGAALYNDTHGSFEAINIQFLNNVCASDGPDIGGGAVYSMLQTETQFYNCTFTNNRGCNGGAIGGVGNSVKLIDCTFENNTAFGTGGGAGNGATGRGGIGGAVYIDGVHQSEAYKYLDICGCKFINNTSNNHAGAVFSYTYPNTGSTVSINNTVFERNTENFRQAGAVYIQNGDIKITNSVFEKNKASFSGALWMTSATGEISNCTFEGNEAAIDENFENDLADGKAGAIWLGSDNTRIVNCTFANNGAAEFRSAIFKSTSGNITLINSLFYNNYLIESSKTNQYGGICISKGGGLTDGGGNMQYPVEYTNEWGPFIDYWLDECPGVSRENPNLLPIGDNGGFTKTLALPEASPAVDAGNNSYGTSIDQRGANRDNNYDIGAYEYGAK